MSAASAPIAPPTKAKRKKRKRRTAERILRVAVIFVAVTLVGAGSVYGYLRFRFSEIKTVKCKTCAVVADGIPYNVLIVGSDSRAGDSGGQFGSASLVGGQRSDTIKVLHVDPGSGTARLLSIPRDTYVTLSGLPTSSGLSSHNKINAAFNYGPDPLIETIENTFGIQISHFVVIDFTGVVDMVNAVGGISLNFPYPVRDDDNGNNNASLEIPHAGCQTLNGGTALALARSRFYQYEVRPGVWYSDGSGDLGRIQRQNVIIKAIIDKAKGSDNPLTLNAFLGSVVHDVTIDQNMSKSSLISLAQNYHAFSGSALQTVTLPTVGAYSSVGGDVQVVQEPAAQEAITQFLGTVPSETLTPPLTQYGSSVTTPTSTLPPSTSTTSRSGSTTSSTTTTTVPGTGPFNPSTC